MTDGAGNEIPPSRAGDAIAGRFRPSGGRFFDTTPRRAGIVDACHRSVGASQRHARLAGLSVGGRPPQSASREREAEASRERQRPEGPGVSDRRGPGTANLRTGGVYEMK